MDGRCDGRTLGGTGLRTTGKALAQHAAAGIGGSHAFICYSFVTRVIDWWGHTDQDQLPCSLMVLQLYPGHVIVHRPTSANTRIAPLDVSRMCNVRTPPTRGEGLAIALWLSSPHVPATRVF